MWKRRANVLIQSTKGVKMEMCAGGRTGKENREENKKSNMKVAQPCNGAAHRVLGVAVRQLEVVHGAHERLHGHEDVLEDEAREAAPVIVRVARAVDDAHLLDDRTLAGLARTCIRHRTFTFTHTIT